ISVYGTSRPLPPQPASRVSVAASATLVDVDRLAVRVRRVEPGRDPHRHAYAAVARRVRRDGRISVNGIATREVHRVVECAERARVEAGHLAVDREAAGWREPSRNAGGRDRDDQRYAGASDDVEHLMCLVDLEVVGGLGVAW